MAYWRRSFAKLRDLLQPSRAERELSREVASHLALLEDEFLRRGMRPEEARLAAKRAYGGIEQAKELHREERSFRGLEQTFQDARFALRSFRRTPVFSVTAILIVALGIGATTAVFSTVDRLLFRSLPYPESDRLVSVGITIPIVDGEFLMANDYFNLREHQTAAFSAIASWTGVADCDLTSQNPQRLACAQVESTFLPTFGIVPILGHNFTRDDDRQSAAHVALLSYGLWSSRFGANPHALGQTIEIDGAPARIVGVLPRTFELPNLAHADLVIPQALAIERYRPGQSGRPLRVFGRLRRGTTAAQASQMARRYMMQGVLEQLPPERRAEAKTVIRSLRDYQIQDVRLASWVLFASTLSILLIVCANVTNLLLARSLIRRRELATRAALGAGRARLVWQALTESATLSILGALPGCLLAWMLLRFFRSLAPVSIPRIEQATVDVRVLWFTSTITFACAIVFGLASTLSSSDEGLLSGGRIAGHSKHRLRSLLTIAQVAVSVILLSIAGLLVESLWNLQNVNAGIGVDHVITADITVGPVRHPNGQSRQEFFETLAKRLRQMPGVEAVAVSDTVPPSGFVHSKPFSSISVAGRPAPERGPSGIVAWRRVSPEYFAALRIPMLEGRTFTDEEGRAVGDVVVLSKSLARRVFSSERAIGREVHLFRDPLDVPPATVVGVCGDVPNNGLSQTPDPEYYVLRKKITDPNEGRDASIVTRSLHLYDGEAFVIVRSSARPDAVAGWIRTEAAALDRTVPVTLSTMEQRMRAVSERPRFSAVLLSLFALIGVVLAAGGLYGLTAFLVTQQTRELGVRMAVGATPRQVVEQILTNALRSIVGGVILGLLGTAATVRLLSGMLFRVPAENFTLFGVTALLMAVVAFTAAFVPALRAAKVDPAIALRHD